MVNKNLTMIQNISKMRLIENSELPLSEQMRIINEILEKEHEKKWQEYLEMDSKREKRDLFNETIYGKNTN